MSSRPELRAKARQRLGGGIFSTNWLLALLAIVIVDAIMSAVSFTGIGVLILVGPLYFGLAAFFLSLARGKEQGDLADLFKGFTEGGFVRLLLLGLLQEVFIILWSLLFIVPGIIKYYQYRLIPYLIASDPALSYSEAQQRSVDLMEGEKMELFIMDLSFLGWNILDAFTAHILGAVWLRAYKESAYAAFFIDITRDGYPCPDNYFDFA